MKNVLLTLFLLFSTTAFSHGSPTIITTGSEVLYGVKNLSPKTKILGVYEHTAILETDTNTINNIRAEAHKTRKCGGYFVHDTVEEAKQSIVDSNKSTPDREYQVRDLGVVNRAVKLVDELNIRNTILTLSNYKNRYYKSETGVKAAKHIAKVWGQYATTELYNHKKWPQPSVIATIPGTKYPNEVIVVGGHIDSISGWFGGDNRAPGADDNASGTATITEILRVLTEAKYKPLRTIKFMGYAAEEVGLRGSSEIAKSFKAKGVNVVGALQLDMTNHKGSDKTIYLVTDYTNKSQTEFISKLATTYVKVPVGYTRCGYACSDHASWHRSGYPAVFPFESTFNESNKKIHTANDLIGVSGNNANHAVNFAKLGLAYVIELDLQGVNL
jgi:leucyl aminopeptidase